MFRLYDRSKWKRNPILLLIVVAIPLICGLIFYSFSYLPKTSPSISKTVGYTLGIGGGGGYNDRLTTDFVQPEIMLLRKNGVTFREEDEYSVSRVITDFFAYFKIISENHTSVRFSVIGDYEVFVAEREIEGNKTENNIGFDAHLQGEAKLFVSPRNRVQVKLVWGNGYRVGITCESYIVFSWLQAESPPTPYFTEGALFFVATTSLTLLKGAWSTLKRSHTEKKLEELIKEVKKNKRKTRSKIDQSD